MEKHKGLITYLLLGTVLSINTFPAAANYHPKPLEISDIDLTQSEIHKKIKLLKEKIKNLTDQLEKDEKNLYLSFGFGYNDFVNLGAEETLKPGDVDAKKFNYDFSTKSNYNYSLSAGYDMGKVRFETTYSNQPNFKINSIQATNQSDSSVTTNSQENSNIDLYSYSINAIYDFDLNNKLIPYIGIGIGRTNVSIDKVTVDNVFTGNGNSTTTSYNLKLGTSYTVSPKIMLFTEANYLIAPYLTIESSYGASQGGMKMTGDDLSIFQVQIGTRFNF